MSVWDLLEISSDERPIDRPLDDLLTRLDDMMETSQCGEYRADAFIT